MPMPYFGPKSPNIPTLHSKCKPSVKVYHRPSISTIPLPPPSLRCISCHLVEFRHNHLPSQPEIHIAVGKNVPQPALLVMVPRNRVAHISATPALHHSTSTANTTPSHLTTHVPLHSRMPGHGVLQRHTNARRIHGGL